MDGPLSGQVAIVTGASRGLGRAFALDLARCGASLLLVARSAEALAETADVAAALAAPCETLVGDVRDDALAVEAVRLATERLGPPAVLVNNAGIARLGPFADTAIDDWWDVLVVDLRAPAVWTQATLPAMRAQGRGRIVNVSSPATTTPLPYISSYGAAKAGLTQFTACLAPEVAVDGIAVLAIGPAALTDMTRDLWEAPGLPPEMSERLKAVFTADPDGMLASSLALFRCVATGGADHVSGQYLGSRPDGFDTPEAIARLAPSPAGQLLARR